MGNIILCSGFDAFTPGTTGRDEIRSFVANALAGGGAFSTGTSAIEASSAYSRWAGGLGIRKALATNTWWAAANLFSPLAAFGMACAIYRNGDPGAGNGWSFLFADWGSGTGRFKMRVGPGGVLDLTDNAGAAFAATTGVLPLESWAWVFAGVVVHGTEGSVRLVIKDIDDVTVGSLDTQQGESGGITRVGIGAPTTGGQGEVSSSSNPHLDDVHFSDDSEPIPEARVFARNPVADVATDWTPDTGGDNYARVNSLSGYVAAQAEGAKDIYEFEALPEGSGDILARQIVVVARKVEAGDSRGITHVSRVNDVDTLGAKEHALATSDAWFSEVEAEKPGGGPWAPDAAKYAGFELTTGESSP